LAFNRSAGNPGEIGAAFNSFGLGFVSFAFVCRRKVLGHDLQHFDGLFSHANAVPDQKVDEFVAIDQGDRAQRRATDV
jgi:hypothetical protein